MTVSPPGTAGRTCYVVLSHTEPDLVLRLVDVLTAEGENDRAVVMHDQSKSRLDPALFVDRPRATLVASSGPAAWGSWALTRASLEAVAEALEVAADCDWVVLLSGSSYPVRPLSELSAQLAATTADGWFAMAPPQEQSSGRWSRWRPFGADRARYSYFDAPYTRVWEVPAVRRPLLAVTGRQPFGGISFQDRGRLHPRTTPRWVVLSPRSVFRRGVRPVRASQWWALRRGAAARLTELLDTGHPWRRHFERTYMSDETMPASYLTACGAVLEDRSTHAQWWPSGPSPATLGPEHLEWLGEQPEVFARKVTLSSGPGVLDALDDRRAALSHAC